MAFEEFIEVGTEYAWWMLSEREAKYNFFIPFELILTVILMKVLNKYYYIKLNNNYYKLNSLFIIKYNITM